MKLDSYNPALGICIPTYKRPDQLRMCVNSIIAAASPFDVPIFIADDSTDATNSEVIAELQGHYPHIVYERNLNNLGIDRNILHSVDICTCAYAWLMGEDDRMLPDAISTVLATLERHTPSFVAVNYSSVNEDVSLIIKEKLMAISADVERSAEEFLRCEAPAIGFIGACVVNKALWGQVDPAPYLDTYFAHVGRILASILGRQVFLVAQPLVLNRAGRAAAFTWSADAYGVYTGWDKVIHRLEPLYGEAACHDCIEAFDRLHGISTLRFMMAKRADSIYTLEIYRRFVKDSDRSPLNKCAAHLVARMPPQIFQCLHSLLFFVRKQRNRKIPMHS